ncbi:MAG: adenylate/guanylate cyclase domain-containing protein [Leptolyngbyaceae cyanobacterium RU_5_1]|nr:adenylate/guanylate cyclase domain-containing protein [Leptolyngbyaceae cyanobacterium RU_5_1]
MWAKVSRKIWKWRGIWLTAPSVAGIVLLLRLSGSLQLYELMAFDQFFRLRPREIPDSRIVIVAISEPDLRKLRRWPTNDAVLAKLLKKIRKQKPAVIGLDLNRNFPIEPGHRDLVKVFKTTPTLIGIEKRSRQEDDDDAFIDPPPVLKKLDQVASNDIVMDQDGKVRRALLYWASSDGKISQECLGLRLALDYLSAQNIFPKTESGSGYLKLGKTVFPNFKSNDGSYVRANTSGYQIMLNYRGPAKTFRTVSLTDVLKDKIPGKLMRDRIVLIGPTAYSITDRYHTPYSGNSLTTPETMAGVEIHANVTSQILSAALEDRSGIRVWSDEQEIAWILLWCWFGAILGWVARSPRWIVKAVIIATGSLLAGCYLAFLVGWWIPVVPAALVFIACASFGTSYMAYIERDERQTIMSIFGRHVTSEIAKTIWRDRDQLLQQGRLPGRRMTATVLFTDLEDFTTISEQTDPEILMSWLNEYMEAMAQIVLDKGGVVDKFIGDSIMAVFGVPIARTSQKDIAQDAYQAVDCAIEMAKMLESLNHQWQSQGRPTTHMRVGISTGLVVAGSLGGNQRLDYTIIGDSVNVAARLESYDKSIGAGICRILINETTYELIQEHFPIQFIANVQLKGREQPTEIYQVFLKSFESDTTK